MNRVALSLSLLSAWAVAGTVNSNYNYQDYLDFGANKGRFKAGESITITSKDGSSSVYIEKMPNFGGANLTGGWAGEFNNIGGSYAISAGHMFSENKRGIGRGTALEFGGVRSRIIATSLKFTNWHDVGNRDPNTNAPINRDFVVQRMDKLNLNQPVDLIGIDFFGKDPNALQGYSYYGNLSQILNNPSRYSMFVRSGTGIQGINVNGERTAVSNAGNYFTGGISTNAFERKDWYRDALIGFDSAKKGSSEFEDFAISVSDGDSGSGVYVYDNVDKKWYLLGVASSLPDCGMNTYKCSQILYTLVNNLAIREFKEQYTEVLNMPNFTIENGGFYMGRKLLTSTIKQGVAYEKRIELMENNKDYVFKSNGSIVLKQSGDLGASVLYISDGLKFSVVGNYYFTHGGLAIGKNATVYYGAMTKANDALVKMGDGKLIVTSTSQWGKLRVGQGEVELKSDGVAFASIYAINGATIKLNASNQVNTSYLYFGINGADLEVNGNSLTFTTDIRATDIGANIKNSSANKATITLQDNGSQGIYHGQFNGNLDLKVEKSYVFDGTMDIKNIYVSKDVAFQAHPVVHNYVASTDNFYQYGTGIEAVNTQEMLSGENIYTAPTSAEDVEARSFKFENMTIKDAKLSQSAYTTITAKSITADNSILTIGSGKIYLDAYDGENVSSTPCSSDNASAECRKYEAYNLEFQYNSSLSEATLENQETYLYGDVVLNNKSSITFNQASYQGNIKGDSTSSASFNSSVVRGSVNVANFDASGSHFLLEVSNSSNALINATTKATGSRNYLYVFPKEKITKKILLVSLKNSQTAGSSMFMPKSYSTNFSVFKPLVEYKRVGDMSNWYLTDVVISENTSATAQANKAISQISSGYVLEWNNLFKRMGELRDEPSSAGLWVKVFGGQSTYASDYKTGFAEVQIGADKHNTYEDFELFAGGLFGASYYNLSDSLSGTMNGISVGAYTSFIFKNGFFVDLIAKYLHYKNDLSLSLEGQTQKLESNNGHFAVIASAEMGYRAMIGEHFYLEPQIELVSGYLGEQALKNDEVKLLTKGSVPLNFKSSLSFGYKREDFSLRAGVGTQIDLLKGAEKSLQDIYSPTPHTFDGERDSRVFINAGGTYNFTDMSRLSFEVERSFLGNFNVDYLINLTFRQGF